MYSHYSWSLLVCPEKFDQSSIQKLIYHWVNNLLCRNDSCIFVFVKRSRASKETIKQLNTLFANQKSLSWSQMLQQAAYKWQPLEHVAYCRPIHFHLSMSPTKLWSWNTGLLLRIENLKNFSSYGYTIHNAPINVMPPPPPLHPKLGYSGAGGDLTDLNVYSPYSGADPVIKFPQKKMRSDWGFNFYSLSISLR